MQRVPASQPPACHRGAYVLKLAVSHSAPTVNHSKAGWLSQVTVVQKDCARCHATRPADEFYRDKHASDGLQVKPATLLCQHASSQLRH